MNEQSIKALQDALNPLAQKLGEGAAQLYAIYVRQMVIEGWLGLLECLAFVVVLYALYRVMWQLWRHRRDYEGEDTPWKAYLAAAVILFIIIAVSLDYGITASVGKILNP